MLVRLVYPLFFETQDSKGYFYILVEGINVNLGENWGGGGGLATISCCKFCRNIGKLAKFVFRHLLKYEHMLHRVAIFPFVHSYSLSH